MTRLGPLILDMMEWDWRVELCENEFLSSSVYPCMLLLVAERTKSQQKYQNKRIKQNVTKKEQVFTYMLTAVQNAFHGGHFSLLC